MDAKLVLWVGSLMKTTTRQRVYDYIWDRLLYGDFLPGAVVSTTVISQMLGVSHIPVREAIAQLCALGILHRTSSRTIIVPPLDRREIIELLEFRATVESHAAAVASRRISPTSLDDLERLIEVMRAAVEEIRTLSDNPPPDLFFRWGLVDMLFHRLILRAAGNREVLRMTEKGVIRMLGFRNDFLQGISGKVERLEGDYQLHRDVFMALKRHDPKAARKAMAAHARYARKHLLERLDRIHRGVEGSLSPARPEYPAWLRELARDIDSHIAGTSRSDQFSLDDSLRRMWNIDGPQPPSPKAARAKRVKNAKP
jgi:DNA-binding GntR family transcriptional regulator